MVPTALLVSADQMLVGGVLRLAAAAGVPVDVVPAGDLPVRSWVTAPAVLVGADQAAATAAASLPRRGQVHVVGRAPAPDVLFRDAVALGADSVLELPQADGWLAGLLSDLGDLGSPSEDPGSGRDRNPRPGRTVAVVGGTGGAGATVLAAGLALVAGASGSVALVDLDPLGPGLRRVVGLDDPRGVTWRELGESRGRLGARALREALPTVGRVGVLGWPDEPTAPPPATLVGEVLSAAGRGHDWVFLDLPRHADPATLSVGARCDQVILVARAALGGVAATARVAAMLRRETDRLGVVVRGGRGAAATTDVARALDLPLLAEMGHDRRLDEHLDLGLGPVHRRSGGVTACARRLLGALEHHVPGSGQIVGRPDRREHRQDRGAS